MALAVYQWSYNGLTFGEGTIFIVDRVTGLGAPGIKYAITPKAAADGSWTWGKYKAERHVIIEGTCSSTMAAIWEDLADLEEAFEAQEADIPLAVNLPGIGARHLECKPLNFAYTADRQLALNGIGLWAVELVAGSPDFESGES